MSIGTGDLAKALGISRQRINELARKGKITREPDGMWELEKVRGEMARNLEANPADISVARAFARDIRQLLDVYGL